MSSDIVTNRKAFRDFEILDRIEVGVSLLGTEVKSIRSGRVDLLGSFARIDKKELYLHDATIQIYEQASHTTHDPKRPRKLLLHKKELARLSEQTLRLGRALPVLRLYWRHGRVKAELGIGRGKHAADQRHDLKKKDVDREVNREVARFHREHK
ncbi:MAG: SsrA-binding protein [Verrucomicrobia bacterium RIFCSPHIGHO2_12_FULL_41_10]|nr:MAG: SsrA-binding protein [Verrucomicrobia bacterium RIFCSPHIGHO2_12_FULL_41_10]HLB32882.1 SsrA-binding protein SmpB [Chthoniobacterales bacterium]